MQAVDAEREAQLPPLDQGLWHPFRRMWVTERKHHPLPDIAEAGGWRSTQAIQQSYLKADPATTLAVVLDHGELREVKS